MAALALLALTAACGGGSGSGGSEVPPAGGTLALHAGSLTETGVRDGAALSARFSDGLTLSATPDGTVFVGERHALRRISPDGQVSTVAGTTALPAGAVDGSGDQARFCLIAGLAAEATGRLLVSDAGLSLNLPPPYAASCQSNRVRQVSSTGVVSAVAGVPGGSSPALDGPAASASFLQPADVAARPGGSLFVADRDAVTGNGLIRSVATDGSVLTVLRDVLGVLEGPVVRSDRRPLATDARGDLYFSHDAEIRVRRADGSVQRLAGLAGSYGLQDGDGASARFTRPVSMTVDALGRVFVLEQVWVDGNNLAGLVRQIEADGRVRTVAGGLGPAGNRLGPLPGNLYWPVAIAAGPTGVLYLTVAPPTEGVAVLRIELPR